MATTISSYYDEQRMLSCDAKKTTIVQQPKLWMLENRIDRIDNLHIQDTINRIYL